jgi:hypothetical protein
MTLEAKAKVKVWTLKAKAKAWTFKAKAWTLKAEAKAKDTKFGLDDPRGQGLASRTTSLGYRLVFKATPSAASPLSDRACLLLLSIRP